MHLRLGHTLQVSTQGAATVDEVCPGMFSADDSVCCTDDQLAPLKDRLAMAEVCTPYPGGEKKECTYIHTSDDTKLCICGRGAMRSHMSTIVLTWSHAGAFGTLSGVYGQLSTILVFIHMLTRASILCTRDSVSCVRPHNVPR
jgi:hypothetical protein